MAKRKTGPAILETTAADAEAVAGIRQDASPVEPGIPLSLGAHGPMPVFTETGAILAELGYALSLTTTLMGPCGLDERWTLMGNAVVRNAEVEVWTKPMQPGEKRYIGPGKEWRNIVTVKAPGRRDVNFGVEPEAANLLAAACKAHKGRGGAEGGPSDAESA